MIREAEREDVPGLLELYRHLNSDLPCAPELAGQSLAAIRAIPGSAVLVAERAGGMVGSVTLIVIPNLSRGAAPYALIENVVTHTDHRGHGIGKAMLHEAARRAWARNCYKVMLMTGSTRPETLGFYAAAGFEQSKTGFQMRRNLAQNTS